MINALSDRRVCSHLLSSSETQIASRSSKITDHVRSKSKICVDVAPEVVSISLSRRLELEWLDPLN
jgi:hypothetical protein